MSMENIKNKKSAIFKTKRKFINIKEVSKYNGIHTMSQFKTILKTNRKQKSELWRLNLDDIKNNQKPRISARLGESRYDTRFRVSTDAVHYINWLFVVKRYLCEHPKSAGPAGNRTPETLVLTRSSYHTGPSTYKSYQRTWVSQTILSRFNLDRGKIIIFALLMLGAIEYYTGSPPEAVTYLEQAIRMGENTPDAYKGFGKAYEKAGDRAKAREAYQRAIHKNPYDEEAKTLLQQL